MKHIITGEKIQQLCDVYLGNENDFNFNPVIREQRVKHKRLNDITYIYNNPYKIFCYSHNIELLSKKIIYFKNDFILVTHNSDGNIKKTDNVLTILDNPKLKMWYGQNVCFQHPKLKFLPIGIANSQWPHGNVSALLDSVTNKSAKQNNVYFNFNINTNKEKREKCYNSIKHKVEWLPMVSYSEHIKRLNSYKFCICPEGNGVDTHRLWECLYLNVVPIVVKSDFTDTLLREKIPIVVLNVWDEFDIDKLNYNDIDFDNLKYTTPIILE